MLPLRTGSADAARLYLENTKGRATVNRLAPKPIGDGKPSPCFFADPFRVFAEAGSALPCGAPMMTPFIRSSRFLKLEVAQLADALFLQRRFETTVRCKAK